jgi:hypothetical protein
MTPPGQTVAAVATNNVSLGANQLAFHEAGDIGAQNLDIPR